jgi:hypothetical protein
MSSGSVQPAVNFVPILLERDAHGPFRGLAIIPGRCGANVVFVAKTLAKLIVGATDMFA